MKNWLINNFPRGKFQRNGDYVCSSPFREDKKPSFSISPDKRCWHDFGTGESGLLSDLCKRLGINEPERPGCNSERTSATQPSRNETIKDAQRLWENSSPASGDHEYLKRKGFLPEGLRQSAGFLLIPARNLEGEVVGVERIPPQEGGNKLHLGTKSGAFAFVGEPKNGEQIFLAEGYATASSIFNITGKPSAAVFGAENLETATKLIMKGYKHSDVVACPDADESGRINGEKCKRLGALVIEHSEGVQPKTDWNDILQSCGIDEARKIFKAALKTAMEEIQERPKGDNEGRGTKFKLEPISARDVRRAKIRNPYWAVDQLVPEGLSVLASPPKCGKSFLVLQMGLAVASGTLFLNQETLKGPVLYCALEDSLARLTQRLEVLEDDECKPDNLYILTDLPRLDDGGLAVLGEWIKENTPRLIIIDTWGKTKPLSPRKGENAFENDVRVVSEVKRVADRFEMSILLVHHLRKGGGKDQDWIEGISGSMGLSATVDGILSLERERGSRQGILRRTGRDFEKDSDIGLEWLEPGWRYLGVAQEVRMSVARKEIMAAIKEAAEPVTVTYIANVLCKNRNTIKELTRRMVNMGALRSTSRGELIIADDYKNYASLN